MLRRCRGRLSRRGCALCVAALACGLALAAFASSPFPSRCLRAGAMLVRNAWKGHSWPAALPRSKRASSFACDPATVAREVAAVMTVKDSCSQGVAALASLRTVLPEAARVVYAAPAHPDCVGAVDRSHVTRAFPRGVLLRVSATASPFAAFLAAYPHVRRHRYVLFLHSDVYAMDDGGRAVCELKAALDADADDAVAFAAPQLYERGRDGRAVPHAHHGTLHVRNGAAEDGGRCALAYTTDVAGLLRREPGDFVAGTQPDFLEDHAFMGRTSTYRSLLDPEASFTLEYMDVALNMRARNVTAVYVPESRFLFDVDPGRVGWRDVAYVVWKRSEEQTRRVRAYLRRKWGCRVPDERIWEYVRHTTLAGTELRGSALPEDVRAQRRLVRAWFAMAGMRVPSLRRADASPLRSLFASRPAAPAASARAHHHLAAVASLPTRARWGVSVLGLVSSEADSEGEGETGRQEEEEEEGGAARDGGGRAARMRGVSELDACDARECHLMYTDEDGECRCFVRAETFASTRMEWVRRVLGRCMLSPRAWTFAQMRATPSTATRAASAIEDGTGRRVRVRRHVRCYPPPPPPSSSFPHGGGARDASACSVDDVRFGGRSTLLSWSWPHSGAA